MNIETYVEHLQTLEQVGDLMYYEGPWESIQTDGIDTYVFVCSGLNKTETAYQWLIYTTSKELLSKVLNKEISILEFRKSLGPYLLTDICYDNKTKKLWYENYRFIEGEELQEHFLDDESLLHDPNLCEDQNKLIEYVQS